MTRVLTVSMLQAFLRVTSFECPIAFAPQVQSEHAPKICFIFNNQYFVHGNRKYQTKFTPKKFAGTGSFQRLGYAPNLVHSAEPMPVQRGCPRPKAASGT